MIYKKPFLAFLGLFFCTQGWLHAAQRCNTPSDQQDNVERALIISDQQDISGINFTGKKLPKDLSRVNLTGANFSGHHFHETNFTGAVLSGVILTNTTCDYRQYFQDNIKKSTFSGNCWYATNLLKDLESITQVYPHLSQDSDKAKLLQIACGLASTPYYPSTKFYIKVDYWSCKLLAFKNQLDKLGPQLVCSLSKDLLYQAIHYCWQTDYPYHLEHAKGRKIAIRWAILTIHQPLPNELARLIQYYLTERPQPSHADFDRYLQLFQQGLLKYNAKSKEKWGYDWCKKAIEDSIQRLKKVYPKLTSQKLRAEAISIAHHLSAGYKKQHFLLLLSLLECQDRRIQLKMAAGIPESSNIHYYSFHAQIQGLTARGSGNNLIYQ